MCRKLPKPRLCKSPGCRKYAAPNRTSCYRCIKKAQREKYPLKDAFYNLRENAKKRGVPFSLTLEQFKKFAIKTEYFFGRGRSKDGYHIDRIDPDKGYSADNIQVLSNSQNQLKKYLDYTVDELFGFRVRGWIIGKYSDNSELPF